MRPASAAAAVCNLIHLRTSYFLTVRIPGNVLIMSTLAFNSAMDLLAVTRPFKPRSAYSGVHLVSSAPRPAAQSESALIARILAGDKALFYDLVRPYERAVFVAAMSVVHNEADAEEVSQEAVLKAFVNLKSFRAE